MGEDFIPRDCTLYSSLNAEAVSQILLPNWLAVHVAYILHNNYILH